MIYFTSSWDDGSIYDIRLAELLLKYNLKATFFVPIFNIEAREVITPNQIFDLSKAFEIGSHTVNHKYLTTISNKDAEYEVKQSKKELESIICEPVNGFCFPGGKYKPIHLQYVYEAGYKYARTVNMFKYKNDSRVLNTTLQAFNHSKSTYFRHLLKRGYFTELFQHSIASLKNNRWDKLLFNVLDKRVKNNLPQETIIIHLWGHSWEIQENDCWHQLEHFFKSLNNYPVLYKTNSETFK